MKDKLLGKIKATFWLNSREERRSEREGAGGPSRGDGFGNVLAYAHRSPHLYPSVSVSLSLLTDGLAVFISPLLSILSETGCHSHHLWTMLFLFSIFHSLRFPCSPIHPLFLSERRCLWLAPSTWLIKKAGRLTWRWREALVSLPDYVPVFQKSTMCQGFSESPTRRYFSPVPNRWPDVPLLRAIAPAWCGGTRFSWWSGKFLWATVVNWNKKFQRWRLTWDSAVRYYKHYELAGPVFILYISII